MIFIMCDIFSCHLKKLGDPKNIHKFILIFFRNNVVSYKLLFSNKKAIYVNYSLDLGIFLYSSIELSFKMRLLQS